MTELLILLSTRFLDAATATGLRPSRRSQQPLTRTSTKLAPNALFLVGPRMLPKVTFLVILTRGLINNYGPLSEVVKTAVEHGL